MTGRRGRGDLESIAPGLPVSDYLPFLPPPLPLALLPNGLARLPPRLPRLPFLPAMVTSRSQF